MNKKIWKLMVVLLFPIALFAQTLNVHKNDGTLYQVAISDIDSITFSTSGSGTALSCPGVPTVSYGGQIYNTVLIGDQCWLRENLNIGTMIDSYNGDDMQTDNGIIEKFCYNNEIDSCNKYGGLYQWNELMQYSETEGSKGICPDGWHIPTIVEFELLADEVGDKIDNNNYSGANALKAIGEGWDDNTSDNGIGTNASGFSALLNGIRNTPYGNFEYFDSMTRFWSSSKNDSDKPEEIFLSGSHDGISFTYSGSSWGYSVRCIKD